MKKKSAFLFLSLLVCTVLLSSCDISNVGIDTETFLEKLVPNIWDFLAQLAAFTVMLLVVIFLAYKPLKRIINKRKDYVKRNVKEAEDGLHIVKDKQIEAEKNVLTSKKTAQEIIESAKKDAINESNTIVAKAHDEANEELKKGRQELEQETLKAQEEIHANIVNVALSASEQILKREVGKADNERLVDDFIDKMNKEKNK
jgi:F-type H+-transporting ATPase subunit b